MSDVDIIEPDQNDWYSKLQALREKYPEGTFRILVKRLEPNGVFEAGSFYDADRFDPTRDVVLPPNSSGKLKLIIYVNNQFRSNITVQVTPPMHQVPGQQVLPSKPAAAPQAPDSSVLLEVVRGLADNQKRLQDQLLSLTAKASAPIVGGLDIETIKSLLGGGNRASDLESFARTARTLSELTGGAGILGGGNDWKLAAIEAFGRPLGAAIAEAFVSEAKRKSADKPQAEKPATQEPTKAAPALPASDVPPKVKIGALEIDTTPELAALTRMVREFVTTLKMTPEKTAKSIGGIFDAQTTETESPWGMIETAKGTPGAIAGLLSSLLPGVADAEYWMGVEQHLLHLLEESQTEGDEPEEEVKS